ncbi:MAG: hypothetical protein WCK96_16440 [Methylococcales bacterium]
MDYGYLWGIVRYNDTVHTVTTGNKEVNFKNEQLIFAIKSSILMLSIYFIASKFAIERSWFVALSVFIVSLPVWLSGVYTTTIKKIKHLSGFVNKGLLFNLFSGRIFQVIFLIIWALFSSFFMLIQFYSYDNIQWFIFFLTIPVFWLIFSYCKKLTTHELKPYLVVNTALEWTRMVCPLIMLTIYIVLNFIFPNVQSFESIHDAIEFKKQALQNMNGSPLVYELSRVLAIYDGFKAYALAGIGEESRFAAILILSIGGLIIFYNACAMLSCLVIPSHEYRRLVNPLTPVDNSKNLPNPNIFFISAIATFIFIFVYIPIFSYIDSWTLEIQKVRVVIESTVTAKVEEIDGFVYQIGTHQEIDKLKNETLKKMNLPKQLLNEQVDRAFDKLEGKVGNYLDWYYSLQGEYTRIYKMLTGELDTYMENQLKNTLQNEDAFKDVQASVEKAISEHDAAQQEYLNVVKIILEKNKVSDFGGYTKKILKQSSLASVFTPPSHRDIINIKSRMFATGTTVAIGSMTALISKKIVTKVIGKGTLKLASKFLAKVAASEIIGTGGGAAAGATAGAAIGSVVPGIGTAIGAAVGGILGGFGVGIATDAAILKLEEVYSRDNFKKEIINSIEDSRREFKESLAQ